MNIIQQPDALSLSYNIRDFRISSTAAVSFVLKKGTTELVAQTYEPGQDGYVTVKVRDIVHAQLAFVLQNISTVYEQPDIVADFTAVIDSTEVTFRVIRAGVDNIADTAANFLTANWLTWQPQEKPVTYSSPEFLTYYAVVAGTCKLKAYYTDESGTVTSEETITVATLTAGKAYTMPMQYAAVSALLGSKLPAFYDVWIENGSGSRLTYIQRYYAGNMKSEQEDWILFENSLGGIDTFRAYGVTDFIGEHTHNIAEIDEVSEEYRVDTERKYQKNTGYLNERERRWLLDFFPSAHKMIYTAGALRSIVVTESDVTYKDKELPSNYTFTYKFADAKPLLNLTRSTAPAEVLNITIPDLGNFTVPPRLVELDSLPLTEGALFPVQSPYDEAWKKTSAGSLFQFISDKLTSDYSGDGGVGHTHNNLDLLQLITYVEEYLLVNGQKIKAGYADDIPSEINKVVTFLKGLLLGSNGQGITIDDNNVVTAVLDELKTVYNIVSPDFSSGDLGAGFILKYDKETGRSYFEVDELLVRKIAYFVELVIKQLRYVGGEIILTPASMTCSKVEELDDVYRCYFTQDDGEKSVKQEFVAGDQARCQTFNIKEGTSYNVSNKYYWRLVVAVGTDYIDLSKTDCDTGSTVPEKGDDIVQLGNRTDTTRQNAIILSTVGDDAPSIKQYTGINSYSLVSKDVTVISPMLNKFMGTFYSIATGESFDDMFDEMQSSLDVIRQQTDKEYVIWFYEYEPTLDNLPASDWTTDELKDVHVEDIFYNRSSGLAYRFEKDDDGVYSWNEITDQQTVKALENAAKAQDTADNKRRVFVEQPTTSAVYDVGDLWVNATYPSTAPYTYENDTLVCKMAKAAGTAFSIDHWKAASTATTAYIKNLGDSILLVVSDNYSELSGLITDNKDETDQNIQNALDRANDAYSKGEQGISDASSAMTKANQGVSDAASAMTRANNAFNNAASAQDTANDASDAAEANAAAIQVTDQKITALAAKVSFDAAGNITNISKSGLVTTAELNTLLTEKFSFDSDGNVTNISKSGLVTEANFAGLFTTRMNAEGVVVQGDISLFITEDDANNLISVATIQADKINFIGKTIINGNFVVDTNGDLILNNITVKGSSWLGGLQISGDGLTNTGFSNDAYIIIRNDPRKTFVGIGGNVLPASSGVRAVARFENEDTSDYWGIGVNYAIVASAKGGTNNVALAMMGGAISGFSTVGKVIQSSQTLVRGTAAYVCLNAGGTDITLTMPTCEVYDDGLIITIKRLGDGKVYLRAGSSKHREYSGSSYSDVSYGSYMNYDGGYYQTGSTTHQLRTNEVLTYQFFRDLEYTVSGTTYKGCWMQIQRTSY